MTLYYLEAVNKAAFPDFSLPDVQAETPPPKGTIIMIWPAWMQMEYEVAEAAGRVREFEDRCAELINGPLPTEGLVEVIGTEWNGDWIQNKYNPPHLNIAPHEDNYLWVKIHVAHQPMPEDWPIELSMARDLSETLTP
jgi:hypothetical protein